MIRFPNNYLYSFKESRWEHLDNVHLDNIHLDNVPLDNEN